MTKGLGIENGSFKWNEVEEKVDDKDKSKAGGVAKGKNVAPTPPEQVVPDTDDGAESSSVAASDASEYRFELRDIDIVFPERQLTVVTGPTASGKTALLVNTLLP
jgi:excinuclease UvrABC ATPase subunit